MKRLTLLAAVAGKDEHSNNHIMKCRKVVATDGRVYSSLDYNVLFSADSLRTVSTIFDMDDDFRYDWISFEPAYSMSALATSTPSPSSSRLLFPSCDTSSK
mmetsp:Transcript_9033/g.20743  ORF Transcript_9033/g.20743 Transcript_9033/m.20743 type:complete len:101 (+) Transcript_9033:34-336(+)